MEKITSLFGNAKTMVLLALVFTSTFVLNAQNAPQITAGSIINSTPGTSSVLVPVSVTSFINIGQFTLTLTFDTTRIQYISATTNATLNGMTVNYTSPSGNTQGKLILSWTGLANTSLTDGSIISTLNFSYINYTGKLNWAYTYGSVCQFKTYVGSVLTALNDNPKYLYYINGGISNRAAPYITAPTIPAPATGTVQIPITTSGFTTIGAITLYMEYDSTIISYQNTFTKNAAFNASFLVGSVAGSGTKKSIVIQWYGGNVSLANGSTLCTLNFTYLTAGTNTSLNWFDNGPSCEFADANGNVLIDTPTPSYLINGSIGPSIKIKGQLLYNNATASPINGSSILLLNSSNTVLATTTTYTDNSVPSSPVNGYYEFNNIASTGNYKVRCTPALAWGGVNSTDALLVKRHTIGITNLTGLTLQAADLNLSNTINSTDALLIQLRNVGIIYQFAAGDWVFGDSTVSISGNGSYTHNINILASGDVNQSYIPVSFKATTYKRFERDAIVYACIGKEIELPVRVSDIMKPGALTLDIAYQNNLIEITELTSVLKDIKYNISQGHIRIAWIDVNAVNLKPNDIIFTLKAKVKKTISSSDEVFSYSSASEFADETAEVFDFSALKLNAIETEGMNKEISAFPNPFNEYTNIDYYLPFDGKLSLEIYDITGKKVKSIFNETQTAGLHTVTLDAISYKPGFYTCNLKITNNSNIIYRTIKIVKN